MEKEFDKVKGALEDFGKKVMETVRKGKGEADKVTRTAQLRFEIGSLARQQKELFEELGELFYRNYKKGSKAGQERIAETVTHVREMDRKVASLKRQLKSVREETPAPRRGRPPKSASAAKPPARRGRPPKSASAGGSTASRRRGRKPKARTETE